MEFFGDLVDNGATEIYRIEIIIEIKRPTRASIEIVIEIVSNYGKKDGSMGNDND